MNTITSWDEFFEFITWCILNEYMVAYCEPDGLQLTELGKQIPCEDLIDLYLSEKQLTKLQAANNSPSEDDEPRIVVD